MHPAHFPRVCSAVRKLVYFVTIALIWAALALAAPSWGAITVGGNAGEVSPSNPATWTSYTYGYIGRHNGNTGTVTVDSGSDLLSNYGYLGYDTGSIGSVTVTGVGSTWTAMVSVIQPTFGPPIVLRAELYFGYSGTGTLTVENGGQVSNPTSYLGYYAGSTGTATVTGSGSTWTSPSLYVGSSGSGTLTVENNGQVNSSSLYVGNSGNGTLTVENGGQVNGYYGYLGYNTGSSGTAMVTGVGSRWTNSGDLYVGRYGSGTLTVENGGLVTAKMLYASPSDLYGNGTISVTGAYLNEVIVFNSSTGPSTNVTFGSGGTLTLNLDGSGELAVGYDSAGTLLVSESQSVATTYGYIGYNTGSTGTATVTGAGSTWTNSDSLFVGIFGSGTLSIDNGGQVTNSYGYLGTEAGSTGTATVNGSGSTWTNSDGLFVGSSGSGTLIIENGGQVTSYDGYLGVQADSTGTATVTGAGSTWANSGDLYVGLDGSGTLTVDNGGLVTAQTLYASLGDLYGNGTIEVGGAVLDANLVIDSSVGPSATVTFGSGGTLTLNLDGSADLGIGYKDAGTLRISEGQTVASFYGYLGFSSGSTGTATVIGAGSKWANFGYLDVGHYGSGTLNIENGGQVTSSTGNLGYGPGSTGTATVNGSGSTWTISYSLVINNGTLRIENGGQVTNSYGYLNAEAGSTSSVTVTGAGSKWINASDLYVGDSGTGTLTVADDGQVTASKLYVKTSQSSVNLRVSGNDMLTVGTASTTGSVTNNGKVNFFADAFLAAGAYTPINEYAGRAMSWSGSGTYNATGGTWDNTAKTFTVAAATELAGGATEQVTTGQRLVFTDSATGQRVGASFGTVASGTTFAASLMDSSQWSGIALRDGQSVLSAWDFDTNISSVSVLLSFDIGLGASELIVLHYDGTTWSTFNASDLIYSGQGIASFTVTGFSSYAIINVIPEPASLGLLAIGSVMMLGFRGRGRGRRA